VATRSLYLHFVMWVLCVVAILAVLGAAIETDWRGEFATTAWVLEPALTLDDVVADPERFAGRRVVARGRYDLERTVMVLGAWFDDRRGARVYTPLRIAEGGDDLVLLVDRGWIPEGEVDSFAGRDTADEEREIYGFVRPEHFGSAPRNAPETPSRRRRWLRPAALQRELPYPLLPMILEREAGSGVELPLAPVSAGPSSARSIPVGLWGVALAAAVAAAALRFRGS
jgi:cytochrome oxidase assembly protein ShyY1